MTPIYKKLKENGTSFYAFPGAAEDISAAYQNQNYKMYFSKYVLLNLPKQTLNPGSGTYSKPVYWDFENSAGLGYGFQRSNYGIGTYGDSMVESLRNYVANYEVTMKGSRKTNTEYYYDNTVLGTPTEKIFWKWCKKLNLIDFEPANNGDEYFGNLAEFERNNLNDDSYFPEILWKEREVIEWDAINFISDGVTLNIQFEGTTNFRVGDIVELNSITDSDYTSLNANRYKVNEVVPATSTTGQVVKLINTRTYGTRNAVTAKVKLVYHKLVQYIGEVNGINNVQEANRSYTEVYAHIPDHTGQTPDILFRTKYDKNYNPNGVFPVLPSQYQPEIIGAANDGVLNFSSPIVNSPSNYPGNYYGQFDTEDFTYETNTGDYLRRSGDYFGISGDINTPIYNSNTVGQSTIDGISIDFDPAHYVKMNIIGREITNFDQFNALEVNNQPPADFEFNSILWYYTVEDINGNKTENLYGISFVDNPDNNSIVTEIGLRVPVFKKLAANDNQDGVSYAFSLNLNFNIINENPQDTYNPQAINSLFSFNLFNESMRRLGSVNDSFINIISSQGALEQDILNMKQLLYSQTDFQTINSKISNLENLLKLYSTNQIIDSESISVTLDNTLRPPRLTLNSKDATYNTIYDVLTSDLYNVNGAIPYVAAVPDKKNFLIYVENNDTNNFTLPNSDKLTIVIDRDLDFKQSCDIIVEATSTATQNKQLEIYIKYKLGNSTSVPVETKLLETIDLPIYYNTTTQLPNSARNWDGVNFPIDLDKSLQLNTGGILEVPIQGSSYLVQNSFKPGDTFQINNFTVGTTSQINFSGQYRIDSVGLTNSYIYFNVNNNPVLVNYGASHSLPYSFNNINSYELSNVPHLKLNKGIKYKITRISESSGSGVDERYLIEKEVR
jgi:hypothetical protein